ncbi:MAG: ABC transporter permease [Actinobacteria bacterium RBG_16_64_13]|nr:MAG: ABC transporter permease [Actinobacteria bacterium RBG_16_64_13]
MDWLNQGVQGILLGGHFALFAVGLALVFGTMRLVNLAHGDLTIVPAYVALLMINAIHFSPFYSIPITMAIMFVVGYLLQRGLLNRVVQSGDVVGVILTFGISIVIQNALLLGFTADNERLKAGTIDSLSIRINENLAIGWLPLIIFLVALVVIIGLQLFLNRTKMGRAFRAVSDDQEAARLMGINTKHIWAMAMGVALVIVAIGGVMRGIRTTFDPSFGSLSLIYAFEAVIIGGMGSGWGTLLGGIILGLSQTLGARAFGPPWSILTGHVVFLIILALRPQGLLAKTVTS